jgi:uncharacterized membrane protein
MNIGIVYAAGAFLIWGLFPLYFQFIRSVPPLEVVLHRSAWSLVFVLGILAWRRQWTWLGETWRQPRRLGLFAISATLLSANWMVYVLAVQTGRVVDASLGYYINPLVNVLLGVLVLRERLRPLQWAAVALAACGVAWLTWQAGQLPWIALVLAISFGLYGLMRKTASSGRAGRPGAGEHAAGTRGAARPAVVDAARPRRAGAGAGVAGGLVAAQRPAHRPALAAVCRRRTAHSAGHRGHAAVHVAQPAIAAGRVCVPRGLQHAAAAGFCADLVGAAAGERGRLWMRRAAQQMPPA